MATHSVTCTTRRKAVLPLAQREGSCPPLPTCSSRPCFGGAFLCASHIFCCWKDTVEFSATVAGTNARGPNCLVAEARALSFRSIVPGPASAGLFLPLGMQENNG